MRSFFLYHLHSPISLNVSYIVSYLLFCFVFIFSFAFASSLPARDDGNDEAADNTLAMVKKCGQLMYWFLVDNRVNQSLAFSQLDFFIETLDDEIYRYLDDWSLRSNLF